MATYAFETITASQALTYDASADTLTFGAPGASAGKLRADWADGSLGPAGTEQPGPSGAGRRGHRDGGRMVL